MHGIILTHHGTSIASMIHFIHLSILLSDSLDLVEGLVEDLTHSLEVVVSLVSHPDGVLDLEIHGADSTMDSTIGDITISDGTIRTGAWATHPGTDPTLLSSTTTTAIRGLLTEDETVAAQIITMMLR